MLTYPRIICTCLGALCLLEGSACVATAQEFPPPHIVFAGVQSTIPTKGLSAPTGLAVDSEGNLYIADTGNDRVVEITAAGAQKTVASGVVAGAALDKPTAVAVDPSFNVFVADPRNNRIVEITPGGEASLIGTGLSEPSGVAVDSAGNVLIADTGNDHILEVSHGVQSIVLRRSSSGGFTLSKPAGISVFGSLPEAEFLVSNTGAGAVDMGYLDNFGGPDTLLLAVATGGFRNPTSAILAQPTNSYSLYEGYELNFQYGAMYVVDPGNHIWAYSNYTAGTPQQIQSSPLSGVSSPGGVAADSSGNIYISDSGKNRILKLTTGPSVDFGKVAVGRSGAPVPLTLSFFADAKLGAPSVETKGALNKDFKLADSGTCKIGKTYEANTNCTLDVIFAPKFPGERDGALNFAGGSGGVGNVGTIFLHGVGKAPRIAYGPGVQTTLAKGFHDPWGVAVDGDGNAYVADYGDGEIYQVTPSGAKRAFAALDAAFSLAVDGAGNLYSVGYDPSQYSGSFYEISPGGEASVLFGYLDNYFLGADDPVGLAVDGSGNVFAANIGKGVVAKTTFNSLGHTIQFTDTFRPGGVAVDSAGNVYLTDSDDWQVWKIAPNGAKSTLGSGYNRPQGIAVDAEGNVFVADFGNDRVVEITPDGEQSTLSSSFSEPTAVAVDDRGSVYVTDFGNGRLVRIDRSATPARSE